MANSLDFRTTLPVYIGVLDAPSRCLYDPVLIINNISWCVHPPQIDDIQQGSDSMSPTPMSPTPQGQAPSDWQAAAESLRIDMEQLKEVYVASMEEGNYDSAELMEVHTLAENAQENLDPRWKLLPSINPFLPAKP